MKLKRIIIIIVVFLLINLPFTLSYLIQPTEVRIKNTIGHEPFTTIEFEKGYVCLSSKISDGEESLALTYLETEFFSDTGFNVRARTVYDYDYYLKNTNPKKIYCLPLNNSSDYTIYFSIYENSYDEMIVNGETIEVFNIDIVQGETKVKRKCWFYMDENNKTPQVIPTNKETHSSDIHI